MVCEPQKKVRMNMNIVLLGGNGYIGRKVSELWLQKNPDIKIYAISRSGKNIFKHSNVINLEADVSDFNSINKVLPDKIDIIINLIGAPEKDEIKSKKINEEPAEVMIRIAKEKHVKAMGMIGGLLGPKYFLDTKSKIISKLKDTNIPLVVVEPTLVYGGDRVDMLSRLVPLFKVLGIFSVKMKPVKVEKIASELIEGFQKYENI